MCITDLLAAALRENGFTCPGGTFSSVWLGDRWLGDISQNGATLYVLVADRPICYDITDPAFDPQVVIDLFNEAALCPRHD